MSCILKISGESLNIDDLLAQNSLLPDQKWKKGAEGVRKGQYYPDTGATFIVSEADLDEFDRQVKEATTFLERNAQMIASIIAFPGVQNARLDFGVALSDGFLTNFCYLPPAFLQLVASTGVGLVISHYGCCKDDDI